MKILTMKTMIRFLLLNKMTKARPPQPNLLSVLILLLLLLQLIFAEQIYHVKIDEETPIGRVVASLLPDGRASPGGRLVLLPSNGDEHLFAFQPPHSSNLTVAKRIDFEQFKQTKSGIATLQIRVGLQDSSSFGLVEVEVADINDNAPHFLQPQFDVSFREFSDKAGSRRQIEQAVDIDSPENGLLEPVVCYSIVSGNERGLFRLIFDEIERKLFIELAASQLDREEAPVHRLQIAARDKGSPALSGYAIVVVSVLDANDNAPRCSDYFINVTASKMPQAGRSSFGSIQVTDSDEGENGQIRRYSLATLPGTLGPRWPVVTIDEKTGQLSMPQTGGFTCRDPCPQLPTSKFFCCFYQVTVFDNGDVPLSGSCRLTITVEYANNHAPVISVRPTPGPVVLKKQPSTMGEGQLSLIVVTDADSGPGGVVGAELIADSKSDHFQLAEKTARPGFAIYSLKLIRDFNWNSDDLASFNLSIRANDSAVPPKVTVASVKIVFENNDDNVVISEEDAAEKPQFFSIQARSFGSTEFPGRFSPSLYHISVTENLPLGTPIFRPNFVLLKQDTICSFSLTYPASYSQWQRPFDVHQPSGYIVTRQQLDRERFLPKSSVDFNITANCTTSSLNSLLITAQIFVKVADENDNAPKFNSSHFFVKIPLLANGDAHSFAITAFDPDQGINGTLTYSLHNISVASPLSVTIKATTGLVTITGIEAVIGSGSFSVCAKDVPGLMSCVPVTVEITAPTTLVGSKIGGKSSLRFGQNIYAFSLPIFGTGFVGCVKAVSPGNTAAITYKISGGSNSGSGFFVHSRSGCIFLVNNEVAKRARQPTSPRLLLELEANQDNGRAAATTSQVLIFQDEMTPQLNVTLPLSALPANLQKFINDSSSLSSFKFTTAVASPGLTVNPHGQISIIKAASSYHPRASSLIVVASNDTTFQRIIIQIVKDNASSSSSIIIISKQNDGGGDIIRLNIDRSTPLFACLHQLNASHRCKMTSSLTAGIEDLISVNSNNCISLVKMKPLVVTSVNTAVTTRFDLACKIDAVKTRKYQLHVTFTESQHLLNFINQNSLLSINNRSVVIDNRKSGRTQLEPAFQLPFPVLPVQGNSWAISGSGSGFLLPNRDNQLPSVSIADVWLSGEPQLGLISRLLGIILNNNDNNNNNRQKSSGEGCVFHVPVGLLQPGQSIGRLRNHLPRHRGRHDRFQLLHDTGSRYVTLDWTAPFGDDIILLTLPPHQTLNNNNNFSLSFRRLGDDHKITCRLVFNAEKFHQQETAFDENAVIVFDAFLPPRSPVFDLNSASFLRRTSSKQSKDETSKTSASRPLFVIRHEIDAISRSIRLTVMNYSNAIYFATTQPQIRAGNFSIFSLPSNFSINQIDPNQLLLLNDEEQQQGDDALILMASDRYQQQTTSVRVIFRPSNRRSESFQLVVDEMRNSLVDSAAAAASAAATVPINVNNNNGISTACSLAVNDLETHHGGRVVFRPAFLRRPNFGESVVFSLKTHQSLFKINNVTGEVVITGFAEKELERFEVVATRIEDGMTSSLSCQAKFASFASRGNQGGGSFYLPVYRFSVDEMKAEMMPLVITPRRQPSSVSSSVEYRLVLIVPPRLEATIDRKTGVISINFDRKLTLNQNGDTFTLTLTVDIAKRNMMTGEMLPIELEREISVIIRYKPFGQAPMPSSSPFLVQFPRSRLFTVPASASIPYVLPVDFRYFTQMAEISPIFRTSLRSPDGCLRIDWANSRILLVKYFHNPPVTTCQLETDSDIFKLTFMKSDGWTNSERLLNASSIPRANSEIVLSELLPPSTIVARIQPILQETTSIYLVDVDPPNATGRFYVTESGELLLHDRLDYDTGDRQFTLRIAAVQLHPIFAVEFANLTLRVKDEDDLAPTCRLPRQFVRTSVPRSINDRSGGDKSVENGPYQLEDQKRPKRIHLNGLHTMVNDPDTTPDQLAFRLVLGDDKKNDDNVMFTVDTAGELYAVFSNNYQPAQWSYDVSFKVESPSGLSSVCALSILVDSAFDQSAVTPCQSDDLFFRVTENTEPGTIIGKINCGLPSLIKVTPNNTSTFPFKLLSNGHIVLTEKLDFERTPVYFSEVSLFDQPSQDVTIQVIDCNDQDPIVDGSENELNFVVVENSPRGTRLGQIKAADGDYAIASPLSYSLSAISPPVDCFGIDSEAGYLFTTCGNLDREIVGEDFFATIVIRDRDLETGECGWTSRSKVVNVRIRVEDINDNPPSAIFPFENSNQFYVVEDRGPGFQIGWFRIVDPDRIGSENIDVQLLEFNETFAIVGDNNEPNELRWLVLRKSVDFETQPQFVLPIQLRDQGGLVAMATVVVNVLDANEHDPHFSQKVYTFSHAISTFEQQRPIGQVWANDGDGSGSEKLEFALEASEQSPFFHIDKWSGELFINRRLGHAIDLVFYDSESGTVNLTAKVYDRAGHFDEATLMITQEIFTAPNSLLNFSAIYLKIAETNLTTDRPLVIFNAFDYLTRHLNKNLALSLSDGSYNYEDFDGLFSVDSKTGEVTLERSVDYESLKMKSIAFRISFTDESGLHVSPSLDVKVDVLDVNDNAPYIYGAPRIQIVVNDDTQPDTVVWTVNATDADSGENGRLTYTSLSSDADVSADFELDPQSGGLKVLQLLDRARTAVYRLEIIVSDSGAPFSLTSTLTLDVIIIPSIVKQPPAISGLEMAFGVFEFALPINPPVDTIVGAVTALAGDTSTVSTTPRFSLIDGDARLFSIGPASGIIRTRQMLFVFARKRFQFNVNVGIAGKPSASSASVVVNLSDFVPSDSGLIFDRPERVVEISESTLVGSLVVNMSQSLRSSSSRIFYSISGGNFDFSFNIDPKTGVIRVARKLDYEAVNVYHLLVKAELESNANMMTYATIDVIVTDDEDSNPVFIMPSTNPTVLRFSKSALATPGFVIVAATARDMDSQRDRLFNYVINNDNPELPLGIEKETGVVKMTAPLAMVESKRTEFVFTIQAFVVSVLPRSSSKSPRKSAPLEIRLIVADEKSPSSTLINLHAPIFTRQHSGTVKNSAPIGWPVIKVTAADPDGNDAALLYAIEDPSSMFPFAIDNKTGVMSVSRRISLDSGDVYVPVLVSDGRHRTRTNVHIELTSDEKATEIDGGNGVEFDRDTYTVDVDDSWPSGKPFLRVSAISGSDGGLHQPISYSIPHPSVDHLITVNATTGELALKANRRLPFGGGALSFKVRANCGQSSYDDATIVVRLRRPLAERLRLRTMPNLPELHIFENTSIGAIVANLTIVPAIQEAIRFYLVESDPPGYFDVRNASIVFIKSVDYENSELRKFTLKIGAISSARDYASLPLLHTVVVSVLDVNDCPPIFELPIIHANLNRTTSSFVTRLLATDADVTSNFKVVNYKLSSQSLVFGGGVTVDSESGTFRLVVRNLMRSNFSGKILFDIMAFNPDKPTLMSMMTVVVLITPGDEKLSPQNEQKPPWGDKILLETTMPVYSSSLLIPFDSSKTGGYFAFLNETSQKMFSIDHKTGVLSPKIDQLIGENNEVGDGSYHDLQLVYFPISRTKRRPPKMVKVRVRRDPERWPAAKCERDNYSANISDLIWTYGSSNVFDVVYVKALFQRRRFSVNFDLISLDGGDQSTMFHIDPKTGLIRAKITEGSLLPDQFNFTVVPRVSQILTLPTLNCTVVVAVSRHAAMFREILLRLQRVVAFDELEMLEQEVEQQFQAGFKLSFDCMAEQTICRATLIHVPTGISREVALSLLATSSSNNYHQQKTRRFTAQNSACLPTLPSSLGLSFGSDDEAAKSASFIDYKLDVEVGQGRPLEIAVQFTLPTSGEQDHGIVEVTLTHSMVLYVTASRQSITARLIMPNRDDQVLAIALDNIFEKTSLQIADLIVTLSNSFWSLELANCRSNSLEEMNEQCWYWASLQLPSKNATISQVSRVLIGSPPHRPVTERFVGCVERVLINGELDLFLLEAAAKSGLVTWSADCACKNRTTISSNYRRLNIKRPPVVHILTPNDGENDDNNPGLSETDWMPFALASIFSSLIIVGLLISGFLLRHRLLSSRFCLRRHSKKDDYRRRSTTPSSTTNSSGEFAIHPNSRNRSMMSGSASAFAMTGMQVVIGSSNGVVVMSGPSPPNSCGDSGFIESGGPNSNNKTTTTAFVTSPSTLTPTDDSTSHSPGGMATDNEQQQLTAPRLSSTKQQESQWALKRATLGGNTRSASYHHGKRNKQKSSSKPAMPSVSPPSIVRPTGYPYDHQSSPVRASSSNNHHHQPWQSVVGSEWEYVPGDPSSSSLKKKSQTTSRNKSSQSHHHRNEAAFYATTSVSFNRGLSQRASNNNSNSNGRQSRQSIVTAGGGGTSVSKATGDRVRRAAPIQPEDQNLWQALLAANDLPPQSLQESPDEMAVNNASVLTRPKTAAAGGGSRSIRRLNGAPKSAATQHRSPSNHLNNNNQQQQQQQQQLAQSSSFGFGAPGVYL